MTNSITPPNKKPSILNLLRLWRRRRRTRQHLKELPSHLLEDIGLSKEEWHAEVRKHLLR